MKGKKKLSSGLHALIWKEGSWFVAKCVEVEVIDATAHSSSSIVNKGICGKNEGIREFVWKESIGSIRRYERAGNVTDIPETGYTRLGYGCRKGDWIGAICQGGEIL